MNSISLHEKLNKFLTESMNNILRTEENIASGRPNDLSAKEIHVIEAVADAAQNGFPARASEIAAALRVAPGTFTASADLLQKKGYLTRVRDEGDRRSIRVALTDSGEKAKRQHEAFHRGLTEEILAAISAEEAEVLVRSLEVLRAFFAQKEASLARGAVKILADSTCDLSAEEAARLGVTLIPMGLSFGDECFRQGVEITNEVFYEKLASSTELPITSQLTPYDLEIVYREAIADGSEVVAIHLSSAFSGTYQSAVLAAKEVGRVYPVDSQNASFGSALLIRAAVALRDRGQSAAQIAEAITALAKKVRLFAHIPTLKYLVRGGRISAAAGLVGGVLNICPIVTVKDGAVRNIGKARGKTAADKEIAKLVETEGIDPTYGIQFGHGLDTVALDELKAILVSQIPLSGCETYCDCVVGPVIGTHAGPGAVGIAFIAK